MATKNQGPVTIYDIAKRAGVNPSTVSRALNSPGRLNKVTEEKIRKAARDLKYIANPFARALPTGQTKILGMMLTDITNPVFFTAIRGAENAAMRHGYTLIISESQESSAVEQGSLQKILGAVDGLVMVSERLTDAELIEINAQKPVVLMNRKVRGVKDVVPKLEPGITAAVDHFASLGHKKILYLSGPAGSWISRERGKLIKKNCEAKKIKFVEIGPNRPTLEAGRELLDRVRSADIPAVFAYNDLMAIGVMQAAAENGLSVPKDFSLIGFDNIFGANFTTPPLTTVQIPLGHIAEDAVENLLGMIDPSIKYLPAHGIQETTLVLRQSTGKSRK